MIVIRKIRIMDEIIVYGILWIRSEANMVGYLNAPNPFDEEGYPYFAAIIDKVEYTDGQLDTGITWHKQGDSKIIGRSLISERDIQLEVPLNSSYSVSS